MHHVVHLVRLPWHERSTNTGPNNAFVPGSYRIPVHVRIGYEYTWYDYGTKPHTRTLFVPCPPGTNGTRIYIISFRTTFVPDVVRKWYECFVSLDVRPESYHTRTFQPHSLRLSCFIRPYFVLISSLVGVRGTNRVRIMSLRTNFVPVPGHSYLTRTIAVPYSYSNVHIPSQQCNSCCIRARFVPYPPIRTLFVTAPQNSYPTSFQWQ